MLAQLSRVLSKAAAYTESLGPADLVRFMRGKYGSEGGRTLVPWRGHDIELRNGTSDFSVYIQVVALADYSPVMRRIGGEPVSFVVDAGANIGLTSLFLSDLFPGAKVVALEVERSNLDVLRRNTASVDRIDVRLQALWSHSTRVRIVDPDDAKWSFRVEEVPTTEPASEGIDAVGLADLLTESGADRIDVLKLDIEGAEFEVFRHETDSWLPRTRLIVAELHDKKIPGCTTEFFRATSAEGFRYEFHSELVIAYRPDGA